jgi:transcriptional regulator with XRE-family HTH domain
MNGGRLIREGRRRAGLTQAELARRVGTTQSAIARLERGRTEPSLERVGQLLRACGLDLNVQLTQADDSNWSAAQTNLALDVDARVRQNQAVLRFARAGRAAMEASGALRAGA